MGEPMRRVPQGIPQNIEWEGKRNRGVEGKSKKKIDMLRKIISDHKSLR
ncbi:hypothetical protein [Scardovia wiggsiae]